MNPKNRNQNSKPVELNVSLENVSKNKLNKTPIVTTAGKPDLSTSIYNTHKDSATATDDTPAYLEYDQDYDLVDPTTANRSSAPNTTSATNTQDVTATSTNSKDTSDTSSANTSGTATNTNSSKNSTAPNSNNRIVKQSNASKQRQKTTAATGKLEMPEVPADDLATTANSTTTYTATATTNPSNNSKPVSKQVTANSVTDKIQPVLDFTKVTTKPNQASTSNASTADTANSNKASAKGNINATTNGKFSSNFQQNQTVTGANANSNATSNANNSSSSNNTNATRASSSNSTSDNSNTTGSSEKLNTSKNPTDTANNKSTATTNQSSSKDSNNTANTSGKASNASNYTSSNNNNSTTSNATNTTNSYAANRTTASSANSTNAGKRQTSSLKSAEFLKSLSEQHQQQANHTTSYQTSGYDSSLNTNSSATNSSTSSTMNSPKDKQTKTALVTTHDKVMTAPKGTAATGGSGNGNGGNGFNAAAGAAANNMPRRGNNKFVMVLALLGLGLSVFVTYKLYEPSLFATEQIEKAKPAFVTQADFNNYKAQFEKQFEAYKTSSQQQMDVLQIKVNILQQQLDNNRLAAQIPIMDHSSNFSDGKNFGQVNSAKHGLALKSILQNYVTEARLNEILTQVNQKLAVITAAKLNQEKATAGNTTGNASGNATNNSMQSPATNATGTAGTPSTQHQGIAGTGTSTGKSQPAMAGTSVPVPSVAPVTEAEIKSVFDSLVQTEGFKTYIGTLITTYVQAHPEMTAEQQDHLNSDIINKTVAQVQQQLSSNMDKLSQVDEKLNQVKQVSQANSTQVADLSKQVETNTQQVTSNVGRIEAHDADINQLNDLSMQTTQSLAGLQDKASKEDVTKAVAETKENLLSLVERNRHDTKLALEQLYRQAREVLLYQNLESTQVEINHNASLDGILIRLRVAHMLAASPAVRQAVEHDIAALTNQNASELTPTAAAAKIATMINEINQLPAVDATKVQAQATQEPSSLAKATSSFFSKFVSVKKVSNNPLNDENANLYLKENLKLSLQNALFALQANNNKVYHTTLMQVQATLDKAYADDNAAVQALQANLKQLMSVDISYDTHYQLTSLALIAPDKPELGDVPVSHPDAPQAPMVAPAPSEATPMANPDDAHDAPAMKQEATPVSVAPTPAPADATTATPADDKAGTPSTIPATPAMPVEPATPVEQPAPVMPATPAEPAPAQDSNPATPAVPATPSEPATPAK